MRDHLYIDVYFLMQNCTNWEMKEAIYLQVSYVGLKHWHFSHFTQDTYFSLERLFCFRLALIGGKRVISIMMGMCNVVLDCMVVFHVEINAWSTSFVGTCLVRRRNLKAYLLHTVTLAVSKRKAWNLRFAACQVLRSTSV